MEEIERFEKALRVVERYEVYLFRRAMGIALVICGLVFPLTAFLVMKGRIIAGLLNMSTEAFIAFVPTIVLLIGTSMIFYKFTSAHVVTSRMRKESMWKDFPHMVVMFMVWFIAFFLTNYTPEPFAIVSWLWAGGGASLTSYLVLKRDSAHMIYPELLIIGLICSISSLPLLLIQDEQLVLNATFLVFSASFIAGGIYSMVQASKLLSESQK